MKTLEALGFTVTAGQIDRKGKNYGRVTADGPVLTPEGKALVAALAPIQRAPRKKADAVAQEPAAE